MVRRLVVTAKNIVTRRLMVGTDVIQLVGENPNRRSLLVYNNGDAKVYILSSKNQTKEDGIPVAVGVSYEDDQSRGALYIVAESGTQDVRVMVVGV